MTATYQLTQLGHDLYRERLARAEAQRPAEPCSRWPGPPAAPNARPAGYAPSSTPRPRTHSNRLCRWQQL